MANVLLIDENEAARKALLGILVRGGHRLISVANPAEGWEFLRTQVALDLVIMEMAPKPGEAIEFIRRLRQDSFLKSLPVAIYALQIDRTVVQSASDLQVQNFLLKPYNEQHVSAQIAKALGTPWRQEHFEEGKSFCVLKGIQPGDLDKMFGKLKTALEAATPFLSECVANRNSADAASRLVELAAAAEEAGAWGAVNCIAGMQTSIDSGDWDRFAQQLPDLDFAAKVVFTHVHPGLVPEPMLTNEEREARERSLWLDAHEQGRCPVVTPPEVQERLKALDGCPVVDSAAAMFRTLADSRSSSLIRIMERVEKDPGLAAQVLISANQLRSHNDADSMQIEDLRQGGELLGGLKLATVAKGLVTHEERLMNAPPFTWPRFRMYQLAVARMSKNICNYLEFDHLKGQAFTAGLLHDLGKLLLAHMYPFGWQAILAHSRKHGVPTAEAARLFIGYTARELADQFAQNHNLPDCYRNVMRYIETPDEAEGNRDLVALVALARDFCRRNQIGDDGDQAQGHGLPLEDTPAWAILNLQTLPSFRFEQFELKMNAKCDEIKRELHNWLGASAA